MKKFMRLLASVLALTMLCEMLPLAAFAQSDIGQAVTAAVQDVEEENDVAFAGGDGTAENPYQIATAKQLDAVRNDLTAHYVLNNDIDLSDYSSWKPIAEGYVNDAMHSFSGSFDGNGHVIRNMTIEVPTSGSYLGLFGYASGANFTNVILEDAVIRGTLSTGNHQVALLVGKTSKTTLSGCTVSGSIQLVANDTSLDIGGVVGQTDGAVIENCVNRAEIALAEESTASFLYCGGIAGSSQSDIRACDNYGKIAGVSKASIWVGGIVGDGSAVAHCRNYGKVSARSNLETYTVAGIAGRAAVYDSVNYGSVSGYSPVKQGGNAAGITGQDSYNASNCYNAAAEITSQYGSDCLDSTAYRIGCKNTSVSDVYSLETTKLNGSIPTTDVEAFRRNGASLSRTELGEKIKELFPSDDPFSGMEEEPNEEFTFGRDNLSFLNYRGYFFSLEDRFVHAVNQTKFLKPFSESIQNGNYSYRIYNEKLNQLIKGLSPSLQKYITQKRFAEWNGSCHGMSVVALLHYMSPESLPLTELGFAEDMQMYDLPYPKNNEDVESLINYYLLSQYLPTYMAVQLTSENMMTSYFQETLEDIVKSVQQGVPVLAGIESSTSGHTVVLTDVISETEDVYKIRIYDPVYDPADSNTDDLQILTLYKKNPETGTISIDYKQYKNLVCYVKGNDLEKLDIRNYFGKSDNEYITRTDVSIIYVKPDTDVKASINGKLYYFIKDNQLVEYDPTVHAYYNSDSDFTEASSMTVILPKTDSGDMLELEITPQAETGDTSIILNDTLLSISSDGPIKLTYDESARTVDVKADDPTAVSLLMTQNETSESWPWHSWAVDTTDTTTLHAELDSEGLHLTGDGLTGAKYATENADTDLTSEGTIFVQPDDTGKTSVTIVNKNDGNTDDTEVKGEDKPEETTYTVTVSGGTASPAKAKEGETVTITAEKTDTFQNWTVVAGGITLENAGLPTTTFTMGKENVVITANYAGGNATPPSPEEPEQPSSGDGGGAGVVLAIGAVAAVAAGIGAIVLLPVKVEGKMELADHTALPDAKIALLQNGKVVAQTTTDADGKFALKVKRGSYELTAVYTDANGQMVHKTVSLKAPAKDQTITF